MSNTKKISWEVSQFHGDVRSQKQEVVATEFPLTVIVNGEEFATMVCSPSHLKELIVGFLASEGIIRHYDELLSLDIDETQGFAYVEINKPIKQQDHSKRFIGSCCGKSRQFYFKSDVKTAKTIRNKISLTATQCYNLMGQLQLQSNSFHITGGVHNAALCNVEQVLAIRTDIGRHNALDKLYGDILIKQIPLHDKVIAFSGRVSSEVLLKISKIGIGILLSKSAPTDLALQLANDLGITVIGFIRGKKMNVYTNAWRIKENEQ
ncbi:MULTISPECIES: formate dehydrogenase accessory sulfurtransferase FdhD [unclassified Virgibacillus]|uniref:formate dehydrogenase accessory sulfurtransferase FdhD n=1 Tax=unclassified Virgibacillus TaxID=2620237 RepID=UPI0024DEAB5F|nr:formate dehydrogenase accessory sulfurtransferase FdhD [Virgibacillus sp. LDC-1]